MSKEKKAVIKAAESDATVTASGTEISTAAYADLVTRYRSFARKTAEGIYQMAITVVEAKNRLNAAELIQFCEEVGLRHDSPSFRKWLKLGENAPRFQPVLHRIPSSWTTWYPLTNLDQDVFDRVTSDSRFSPTMTAKDLNAIIKGPAQTSDSLARDVTLDLSQVDHPQKIEFCRKLKGLAREYPLRVKIGPHLTKELKPKEATDPLALLPEEV